MSVLGQSLNLLSSILTILLTCANNNTLLCYSNDPLLTVWCSPMQIHSASHATNSPEKAPQPHSLPVGTSLISVDSGLGRDVRATIEQSEVVDASAGRHSSPDQPDSGVIADLERQLIAAQESQQQLQNELNQIRENQLVVIEDAKREVCHDYESQIASYQQSLLQTEVTLQSLERQLSESLSARNAEIENVVRQQESMREASLREKDLKHAEHIARLTAELTSQQEIGGGALAPVDPDEQEAGRLRMIKEKMAEMHALEKESLSVQHKEEIAKVQEEFKQQMLTYRHRVEQLANTKLQELHTQFMSAHQAVVDQKDAAEASVGQWQSKVEEMDVQIATLNHEKLSLEEKYCSILESHSAELELLRQNSTGLEKRLDDWKEKAVNLERRLDRSQDPDELHRQNDEAMHRLRYEYEEKLRKQQLLIGDYEKQLEMQEANNREELEALQEHHRQELAHLTVKHSSELNQLEESFSDTSVADRASLEVAEEHMRSVQNQLEEYRTQENNLQSRLADLKRQHTETMDTQKQRLESQKAEEIAEISTRFESQIERLEEELTSLQDLVEASQSSSQDKELIEALKAKHRRELLEVETNLQDSQENALRELRKVLEGAHAKAVELLNDERETALQTLRSQLEHEWTAKLQAAKEGVATELEMAKDVEIDQLQTEHKCALRRLREQLTQSEEGAIAKAESQVMAMETEVQALREKEAELVEGQRDVLSQLEFVQRQLQESNTNLMRVNQEKDRLLTQCAQLQSSLKSQEVDLNVAQNVIAESKGALGTSQQELEQWKARVGELEGELGELEAAEETNAEQARKVLELTDQLVAKNVQLVDLLSKNDSLNTEVYSLTQKCQQHIAASEAFRQQLEGSGSSAAQEIASLQTQLSELIPIKDNYEEARKKVGLLEEAVADKEREVGTVRSHLEKSNQQLIEVEAHWSAKYTKASSTHAREIEGLQATLSSLSASESELKQQVESYRSELSGKGAREEETAVTMATLNRAIKDLENQLESATTATERLTEEKDRLEKDIGDSRRISEGLAKEAQDRSEALKNYEQLQEECEELRAAKERLESERSTAQDEQQGILQNKLQEQERTIQELQSKLSARESAFTEIQSEFGRQLTEVEMRESSLIQALQDSKQTQDQLGSVLGEKGALEQNLSQARQALMEKLQEKTALDKELSFHRTELERRLGEKQRMEELLFEKSRLEQELQSQKDQLREELDIIESKLQTKQLEFEQEKNGWSERETELREHEQELRLQHATALSQTKQELSEKHSSELTNLTEGLHRQHDRHVSSLQEDHRSRVAGVEAGLRREHSETVQALQDRHRKEVN